MILQALYDYYRRKPDLPPLGFERKEIPFLIILDEAGNFIDLHDTRESRDNKLVAKSFLVPKEAGRSGSNSWMKANLLWDHYGYVLGHPKSDLQKDNDMAIKQHQTFYSCIEKLVAEYPSDVGIGSVYIFLKHNDFSSIFSHNNWVACSKIPGCNISFKLSSAINLICESETVKQYIGKNTSSADDDDPDEGVTAPTTIGFCLVSGQKAEIARVHPRTPVLGAKSNAKLVSFQKNMGFDSYGKEQGSNAPVGKQAAFAYTTALNHLLRKDSRQRLQVGDASTVFWAEQANPMEDLLADLFGEPPKDNPDCGTLAVESLYKAPQTGVGTFDNDGTRFFVLGLAPNAARIAVRFWQVVTVGELAKHIKQHFADLAIVHGSKEMPYLPLRRLLNATTSATKQHPYGDPEKVPPNLAGDFMQSILAGTPYPQTLLQAAIRRVRAEHTVTYARASLIKACLNRQSRYHDPQTKEELTVPLDESNTNRGYRLGRLFAVLEKIQEEANPGINATIRDRYYGAASSTPVTVFQTLMRLKNHHLSKLDNRGRAVNLERLISEIMDVIDDFPPLLCLPDQGRFTVGYYHQRQDLFTKK